MLTIFRNNSLHHVLLTNDGLLAYGREAPGEMLPKAAAAAALSGSSSRGHSSGGRPTCGGIWGKNGG